MKKIVENLFKRFAGSFTDEEELNWRNIDDTRIRLVKMRFKNTSEETQGVTPEGDLTSRFLSRRQDKEQMTRRWTSTQSGNHAILHLEKLIEDAG